MLRDVRSSNWVKLENTKVTTHHNLQARSSQNITLLKDIIKRQLQA